MSAPATQRLPRGPHGLSRDEVRASQRGRMLEAMARAAAEKGYAATTVADVIARAGVSRATFYEHFGDKEDCFVAAFDAGVDLMLFALEGSVDVSDGTPVERLDRVLRAYLDLLAAEPAFARTFLVEVYAAGPRTIERRAELQGRFVDSIADVLETDERFACEALVAAISSLVTSKVGAGRANELPALREPLVDLVRRARLAP
jgi:AcrR family transcriptional regulator